jgi:hypothetical protein
MSEPKTSPEDAPGHYGAGYGEQVPAGSPPQPAPKTDDDAQAPHTSAGADADDDTPSQTTSVGDNGQPVAFTPEDVHPRPPDHPPTESAPESEKAGLIFERS